MWSAYIAVPAAGWGWLDGPPLGRLEAAALALVWWAWSTSRRLPGARVLAVLAVAKVALAGVFVDRGFTARYYSNDTWSAPVERSVEFPGRDFTRRDERLVFGVPGMADLPLHFFNDLRFNYFLPDHPRRDRLPYSIEWRGHVWQDGSRPVAAVYMDAGNGVSGELSIDERPVITFDDPLPRLQSLALQPGWHRLVIRIKAPYGASRRIEAGELVDGVKRPFDASRGVVAPAGTARMALDGVLRQVSRILDAVTMSWLVLLVVSSARQAWRQVRFGRLLWFAAIIEAFTFAGRYANATVVLSGGDDWLAYESFSRAIALGDWIVAGQNDAFYYQPLYSYFLAVTHLLFGDDLFGAVLVQRLLLAATVGWVAAITRDLFGSRAGVIALVGGGAFLYVKVGYWTHELLTEMLFVPLLVAWVAMVVRMAVDGTTTARAAAAGVLGGFTTLTRSTFLLTWPPTLVLLGASLRARRALVLAALLATMMPVIGMATLRNWIVADRLVLVASSLGNNLQMGNPPTFPLAPTPPERIAAYERLGLENSVRTVIEFALQTPGEFTRGLYNKALYTVGFFRLSRLPGGENMRTSWLYVGMWVLSIAGAIRLPREARSSAAVWLPASVALSHFVVSVVIIPFGYGDRYILPLYPLLIPYAAFAVEPLPSAAHRLSTWLRAVVPPAAAWIGRTASAVFDPVLQRRRLWLYLGYMAAVSLSLDWQPDESDALDLATALLLPAAAFGVTRLTRSERVQRLVGGAIWTMAFMAIARGGSRAVSAINDPLFWGLMAVVTVGSSAVTSRWPTVSAALATIAGGCTMAAVMLPAFPGFESTFPGLDVATIGKSLTALSQQLGLFGAVCLLGVWVQGIIGPRPHAPSSWKQRIVGGTRGALLAAFILTFAGALPVVGIDARLWFVTLGALLGLVEAARV
jgi:hypothetical protein